MASPRRTHLSVQEIQKICQQAYKSKGAQWKDKKDEHFSKYFQCPMCDTKFATSSTLAQHLRTHINDGKSKEDHQQSSSKRMDSIMGTPNQRNESSKDEQLIDFEDMIDVKAVRIEPRRNDNVEEAPSIAVDDSTKTKKSGKSKKDRHSSSSKMKNSVSGIQNYTAADQISTNELGWIDLVANDARFQNDSVRVEQVVDFDDMIVVEEVKIETREDDYDDVPSITADDSVHRQDAHEMTENGTNGILNVQYVATESIQFEGVDNNAERVEQDVIYEIFDIEQDLVERDVEHVSEFIIYSHDDSGIAETRVPLASSIDQSHATLEEPPYNTVPNQNDGNSDPDPVDRIGHQVIMVSNNDAPVEQFEHAPATVKLPMPSRNKNIDLKYFRCQICSTVLPLSLKEYHMPIHNSPDEERNKQAELVKLEQKRNNEAERRRHPAEDNSVEKPFECDVCHRRFANNSRLQFHIVGVHGPKIHKCHLCDYKCSRRDCLEYHVRKCRNRIEQRKRLEKSVTEPEKEQIIKCGVCERPFTKAEAVLHLYNHMQTHFSSAELRKRQMLKMRYPMQS